MDSRQSDSTLGLYPSKQYLLWLGVESLGDLLERFVERSSRVGGKRLQRRIGLDGDALEV
jgi:hypothetical protein